MSTVAPPLPSTTSQPTWDVERLLQINVGLLVILGTWLLSIGQQNLIYTIAAIVAVGTSLIVTDIRQIFHLGRDATTLAALVSCMVLAVQVVRNAEESQLLNVANILIFLEVILLFQKKTDRTYWSLLALSLFQVIVAAALNLGFFFGIMLAAYVLLSFSAMTMFFAVRETRPFIKLGREPTGLGISGDPHAVMDPNDTSLDVRQYSFVGTLPEGSGSTILNRSLRLRLLRLLLGTAIVTVIVFLVIPRYSNSVWQGARPDQVATVGFTEEVRLDDISRILESPEQVMRVEFTDVAGFPYQVDGEPYFRGTVLSQYNDRGVWRPVKASQATRRLESQTSFDLASTVLQQITLQPGSHSVLFNVAPCYYVDGSPRRLFDLNLYTRQLTLDEDEGKPRGQFRYTLGTTAFRNGWQRDLVPAAWNGTYAYDSAPLDVRNSHPFLSAKADQVLADQGMENMGVFEKAKTLENHFRRTGEYFYSLDVNRNRNRNLDPIEDFVRNHKTGHCEFFAGALTLMLRSQGIPARMVVGFKGGEFNTVGSYYIVRELHAHAWVEAYLREEEIPLDEREELELSRNGAWLRLDPTPGGGDVDVSRNGFWGIATAREIFDYFQVLWDDYVLGLNATRQQQAIYGPIMRSLRAAVTMLFSPDAWSQRWQWLRRLATQRILGVPGFIVGLAILLVLAGTLFLFRRRLQRGWSWVKVRWQRRHLASIKQGPDLAAYRNLEKVLALIGLSRRPGQTPSEFARQASDELAAHPAANAWASLPGQIADTYYRVRYGGETLDADQEKELTDRVWALRQALS